MKLFPHYTNTQFFQNLEILLEREKIGKLFSWGVSSGKKCSNELFEYIDKAKTIVTEKIKHVPMRF